MYPNRDDGLHVSCAFILNAYYWAFIPMSLSEALLGSSSVEPLVEEIKGSWWDVNVFHKR